MATKTDLKVEGFAFSAMSCGLKKGNALDLGLICTDEVVPTAAVLTQNRIKAAPVQLTERRVRDGLARAILVNSGNANACTGALGMQAALQTTQSLAKHLGCKHSDVLAASTGVIGLPLPASRIEGALPALIGALSPDSAAVFSEAIMTTDRWPKIAKRDVNLGKHKVRVLGMAKGAGMIHPNMATTLCFVLSDAKLAPALLRQCLRKACDESFNRVTVDGDTSTNDMISLMASGKAMSDSLKQGSPEYRSFLRALTEVLQELSESIVRDGEGAEHCVRIVVKGLASQKACRAVAQKVATSLLVKTALHGADPNWGRLLMAAGNAGVAFDGNKARILIDQVTLVEKGVGLGPAEEKRAAAVMKKEQYTICLELGASNFEASYLTSDIGHEYVRINADYRS
ncbi:MAG: bifunctional glutamate N-acetyltransferase/amino-acid acetyltransferase ArgJ [Myxococcales bacterium]|nr:MAG: bifunctional glutamate N-acetyltransferase/amino-acid acetyltransferase ArgJ [Myxococcales bacterium]